MKKFTFALAMLLMLCMTQVHAQQPNCANDNMVVAKVNSYTNRGWTEFSREYYQVAYLVAPTPPYLIGTLEVKLFGPYCGPACTPGVEVLRFNATVVNNNGNCVWNLEN
jgi:hypothetical protein